MKINKPKERKALPQSLQLCIILTQMFLFFSACAWIQNYLNATTNNTIQLSYL